MSTEVEKGTMPAIENGRDTVNKHWDKACKRAREKKERESDQRKQPLGSNFSKSPFWLEIYRHTSTEGPQPRKSPIFRFKSALHINMQDVLQRGRETWIDIQRDMDRDPETHTQTETKTDGGGGGEEMELEVGVCRRVEGQVDSLTTTEERDWKLCYNSEFHVLLRSSGN